MDTLIYIVIGAVAILFVYNAATHGRFVRYLEDEKQRRRKLHKHYMRVSLNTDEWEGDGLWIVSSAIQFLVEVDEEGEVVREIGLDDAGVELHRWCFYDVSPPNRMGFSSGGSAFDHNYLPKNKLRDDLTSHEFDDYWQRAKHNQG